MYGYKKENAKMKPKLEKILEFTKGIVISGIYAIFPQPMATYYHTLLNNYGRLK